MWTSEARSPTAWVMIALHELDDRRVLEGRLELLGFASSASAAMPRASASTWPSIPANLWIARSTSFAVATTRLDLAAGDRADVVEGVDVGRVGHRDQQLAVALADRERAVPARERLGQQRGRRGVDRVVAQVDELQADLLGQRADEVALLDHAEVDQHAADATWACLAMLLERIVELLRA